MTFVADEPTVLYGFAMHGLFKGGGGGDIYGKGNQNLGYSRLVNQFE